MGGPTSHTDPSSWNTRVQAITPQGAKVQLAYATRREGEKTRNIEPKSLGMCSVFRRAEDEQDEQEEIWHQKQRLAETRRDTQRPVCHPVRSIICHQCCPKICQPRVSCLCCASFQVLGLGLILVPLPRLQEKSKKAQDFGKIGRELPHYS